MLGNLVLHFCGLGRNCIGITDNNVLQIQFLFCKLRPGRIVIAIALSLLIGDGAAAYISLKLGEGEEKSAARGVGCSILVIAIVGMILCILFNLFLEPLCILFGATEDILPYAMDYGRIISYGVLFSSIDSGMAGMIRADGSPKFSMAGLLVGCITNIILDPIFIFAFHWGVKGAAWATIPGRY